MGSEPVTLTVDDGVATVTLNQPDMRNAFSEELLDGLSAALDDVDPNTERCVVIEGAGKAFSAGGDLTMMQEFAEATVEERRQHTDQLQKEIMEPLIRYPLPTVAKVDGPALGGGANIALSCDVQLASERAEIGFVFRRIGLCIDTGASFLLPRIVGANVAKELIFTGEIVTADRAKELGLFNHVYPTEEFDDRCDEFISQLATGPTVALKHGKRLVNRSFERSLEECLEAEAMAQAETFTTDDTWQGIEAFLEGRDPDFTGK